jgi:CRISPR-associated endonuclease/helicase Cas3
MTEIIGSLVDRHVSLGGYVLLLSATLGEAMRARLLGQPRRSIEEASAVPYPAVAVGAAVRPVDATSRKHVAIEVLAQLECVQQVMEAVETGAAVLWIRSTVADAIEDYRALHEIGVPTILHHSRWADHDRRILDDRVIAAIGLDEERGGRIVVATQTCEQSLDIDADLLVTDACPADVLIQRLGRLHRHRRQRPTGFEAARCLLIDPDDLGRYVDEKGRPHGFPGQGWPWVYRALLPVQQTLAWVQDRGAIIAPDDCRILVERATHPDHLREVADRLGDHWPLHWQETYGREAAQRALGQSGLIDWSRPYSDALVDERHLTRLAEGPVTIEVDVPSPLDGLRIESMPVPARWLRPVPTDTPAVCEGQRIRVGDVEMLYEDVGLVKNGRS